MRPLLFEQRVFLYITLHVGYVKKIQFTNYTFTFDQLNKYEMNNKTFNINFETSTNMKL